LEKEDEEKEEEENKTKKKMHGSGSAMNSSQLLSRSKQFHLLQTPTVTTKTKLRGL
jgi:hypothetical protein